MTCIRCELIRARLRAMSMALLDIPLETIAATLSDNYGEAYEIDYAFDINDAPIRQIIRKSKLPPYGVYVVYEQKV